MWCVKAGPSVCHAHHGLGRELVHSMTKSPHAGSVRVSPMVAVRTRRASADTNAARLAAAEGVWLSAENPAGLARSADSCMSDVVAPHVRDFLCAPRSLVPAPALGLTKVFLLTALSKRIQESADQMETANSVRSVVVEHADAGVCLSN